MIRGVHPLVQALLASLFTWGVTGLGAGVVFVISAQSRRLLDASLGFAAGVMTAASFWSLLAPALDITAEQWKSFAFVPAAIGFILGGAFVYGADRLLCSLGAAGDQFIMQLLRSAACEDGTEKGLEIDEGRRSSIGRRFEHGRLVGRTNSEQPLVPLAGSEGVRQRRRQHSSAGGEQQQHMGRQAIEVGIITTGEPAGGGPRLEERATQTVVSDVDDLSLCQDDGNTEDDSFVRVTSQPKAGDARLLSWRRIFLLIVAITVHNIPEGLAVGVGFGAVNKTEKATFESAFNLAVGIGLQNFPEGLAVSLPLAGFGYSKFSAFFYGQLSGMVEPAAALLGAGAVMWMEPLLPYALAFAAGAMIFVVVDDIIPESQQHGNGHLASWSCLLGFTVMMALDVGLG